MRTFKLYSFAFVAILSLALFTVSCRKKKDTIAKITVVDFNGDPVGGATVYLYGTPSISNPPDSMRFSELSATTDAFGIASFNFNDYYKLGQAGFAVLDIYAETDSTNGSGIIKIIEEKTNEATVTIN